MTGDRTLYATRIDGTAAAADLRRAVAGSVAALAPAGLRPGLATVIVGHDPASLVYIRSKVRQATEVGLAAFDHKLPASIDEADLLSLIGRLNADERVDGILVQLPLPGHIDTSRILEAIDPLKDVDGFHPLNAGRLAAGARGLVPCTPLGCLLLLRGSGVRLDGLHAVVIGRSGIVGKPMAQLLLQENCTVTIAHSRTRNLPELCRQADILVAAIGRPEFVRGDWIKPGAIVLDVGINRLETADGRKLVGDVAFQEAAGVARAVSPVPGGIGPMTIACLLRNTVEAACRRRSLASPFHN